MSNLEKVFGTLTSWAHTLGKTARDTSAAVRDIYKDLEPTITAALNAAKAATDGERRQQAIAQFEAYVTRATASGSSYLKQTLGTLVEAFNGVPPELAAQLSVYTTVKEAAVAKGAETLREVRECDACVTEIREAAQNKQGDFSAIGARFEKLVVAASAAVAAFSSDEADVRRLVIRSTATLEDLTAALGRRDAGLTELATTVKDADCAPVFAAATIDDLATRRQTASDAVDAGKFAEAALALQDWQGEAEQALQALNEETASVTARTGEPGQLRRLLGALVKRAQDNGKLEGAAATAAADANAKVKERPCDVPAARAAVDAFEQLVRD